MITWMYFWTPTKDFLRASKEEEYSIFFLTLAVSGHQDIRNNFCFLEACNRNNAHKFHFYSIPPLAKQILVLLNIFNTPDNATSRFVTSIFFFLNTDSSGVFCTCLCSSKETQQNENQHNSHGTQVSTRWKLICSSLAHSVLRQQTNKNW